MPLPSALAAKLAKRGIIQSRKSDSSKANYKGWSTCPNKSNIYHDCTVWCETHWNGVSSPDAKYVRNIQKLLYKYPLPNNWTEVFDKGLGRYYYWNMENDLVSWLPPRHPKSIKAQSAAKLRENRITKEKDRREMERNDSDSDEDRQRYISVRDKDREDRRHKRDDRYSSRKKTKRTDIIDPMDPAAYSDIPQGTWSDGLENNKSRADSTASGVLYQQRPYPAPGEVLASNKEKLKKK